MTRFDRRTLLGLGPLTLAGCSSQSPYFGYTNPPAREQLICATNLTAASLDPAKTADFREGHIIRALFEGLTNYHPQTMEPMAGIATHHETSSDGLRLTLFLRGQSHPRGSAFPNTATLRDEYLNGKLAEDLSRGRSAAPDRLPVYWSDGMPVTAHDIVYSWRRVLDPATAAPYAYLLYYIQNAQAVNVGRMAPDKLGLRALDNFTLQIDLRAPTPFFPRMLSWQTFRPVPRQAIESAQRRGNEGAWIEPGEIVTSGPFLLREQRSRDRIVVGRNRQYYEAGLIAIKEVSFLLTGEATSATKLYKSGQADLIQGVGLPAVVLPTLSRKRDFRTAPAFGTYFPCFNIKQAPFDNLPVRHAFNMAVNKNAMVNVFGGGRIAAQSLVPPLSGYTPPKSLPIRFEGRTYDVLSFNPAAARELLAYAGFPGGMDSKGHRLTVDLLAPSGAEVRTHCEILQQQWRSNLSVSVRVASQEFNAWLQDIFRLNYRGITHNEDWGFYLDPNWFLDQFTTASSMNVTGWADPQYDAMLASANATLEPSTRMKRLAECEQYLLLAMPMFPICHEVWAYPKKPYVRGMSPNIMDVHSFKYEWIDTNWRS